MVGRQDEVSALLPAVGRGRGRPAGRQDRLRWSLRGAAMLLEGKKARSEMDLAIL